jgi:hypothetical protein
VLALQAAGPVDPKLLEESGLSPSLAQTHQFFEGAGCMDCGGSGFKGARPSANCSTCRTGFAK